MKTSIEISLYPIADEYVSPIKDFIHQLQQHPNVLIQSGPASTIVAGEHEQVMDLLKVEIKRQRERYGKCVFVTKILPDYNMLSDN